MAEIVRKEWEVLRACVFYERLQKTSIDEALQEVCNKIRWNVSMIQFRIIVGVRNYNFVKDSTCDQIAESLRTDPIDVYRCVLYEFIKKKPLGQAYKKICELLGGDVIAYDDMKNRFENFKNGRFEDYEETYADILKEYKLKKFKFLFSDQEAKVPLMKFYRMEYRQIGNDAFTMKCRAAQLIAKNRDYLEGSLNLARYHWRQPGNEYDSLVFRINLGNPLLKTFDKRSPAQILTIIEDFFKCLPYPLHVRHVSMYCNIMNRNGTPLLSILPYLKPGVLEKIRIGSDYGEMMHDIIKTDQWKQAVELGMKRVPFDSPMKNLWHFKTFKIFRPKLTVEEVVEMKETLFKIATFESCVVVYPKNRLVISRIEERLGPHTKDPESGLKLYKSQHTNLVYTIQVLDDVIKIISY